MSGRLAGKRALLTAAGQGIGRATALAFAREGATVIATDVNAALLDALREAAPAIEVRPMDVTVQADVDATCAAHPDIEVLFNCAGRVPHGALLDCPEEDLEATWQLNVVSMHRTISAWLPSMLGRGAGSIVNVASVASSITGAANRFAYGTTKAAVIGLTRSVATDYVGAGIRCNAIAPGTVATPSLEERIAAFDDPEAARAAFIARQPMGRLGTAEEVAALAVHLASDEASYTTGGVHVIDGGWTA
jgi:2-keto-3-deoxy-L-fuconate dehydrogenase